ncbi:MFS transporter [Brevibacillus daliensis]|uniref:MFS transporter n=1 Tax=Brevibacillus daliensis TaxID=2892995 RepID=UPI001E4F066B|nr:aromatic acid/H+ symport family MFS transporter [Brevibacillus daliensis]
MSQISLNQLPENVNGKSTNPGIPRRLTFLVVAACWFAMLADGYDLGIYGAVLPKLLEYEAWSLTSAQAGAIGSYALAGMLVGAVCVGTITDIIGRKWTLISCIILFSITMGLAAMAATPGMFGFYRFIGGIGLGGVIPTASALTIEYSPTHRRSLTYALMFTGYSLGTVLGAIFAILFLEQMGWQFMFWIGAIPLLFVPFLMYYLPESVSFLVMRKRMKEAEAICKRYHTKITDILDPNVEGKKPEKVKILEGLSAVFSPSYRRATIFLWITYIMGFYLVYGLNTWLPQMMRQSGYPLGSSLSFLLTLNLSATIGALLAGTLADRFGSKHIISISYLMAAICIALLTVKSSMFVVYLLVGIAGFGTVGITQVLNAYVTKYYPSNARATGIGLGLGCGRIGAISGPIVIGILIAMQVDQMWSFYTFVITAFLACVAIMFVPDKKNEIV